MASFAPIALTIPNYRDFNGFFLKAFLPGTTTPKVMATDNTGDTTVSKFELDKDGFPKTSGGALITPYISGAYDLFAFPTEAEADANDTANALRFAINVEATESAAINVRLNPATLAIAIADTTLEEGNVLHTKEDTTGNGGGAIFDIVLLTTVTPNGDDIFASTGSPLLALVKRRNTRIDQYNRVFTTLNDLVNNTNQLGESADLGFMSSKKMVVKTGFNNTNVSNTSPGGGAEYQILTAAAFGATPDGALLNGVFIGGDHFIGGGTAFVAKLISEELGIEMFGCYVGQTIVDSTTAFDLAIAFADALGGKQLKLPRKRIGYEGVNDTAFRINIAGEAMPDVSVTEGTLVGGSIIEGSFRMRPVQGWFKDFGVDRGFDTFGDPAAGGSTALDAFKVSERGVGDPNFAQKLEVHNVVGLCQTPEAAVHAVLLEGYQNANVTNIRGVRAFFGNALKLRKSNVYGVIGESNGRNCLIVKSDATFACQELSVYGVVGKGIAGDTAAIVSIEAENAAMRRVSISGVHGTNATSILKIDVTGTGIINELTTHDWSGTSFDDPLGTGLGAVNLDGTVFGWDMSEFKLTECNERAFDLDGVRFLTMSQCSFGKGAAANAFFNVDFGILRSTVSNNLMNQVTLHNDFSSSGFGTIAFNNAAGLAKETGANWFVKTGVGAPP